MFGTGAQILDGIVELMRQFPAVEELSKRFGNAEMRFVRLLPAALAPNSTKGKDEL